MTATSLGPSTGPAPVRCGFDVVVLAASLGGVTAIASVLAALPATFPTSVLVVQHGRRRPQQEQFARTLGRRCALPVQLVADGRPLTAPGVGVVPTGTAATVTDRRIRLADSPDRRPADALLTSVAPVVGRRAIAVVLTGRLDDGAAGARAIKRHGGRVLAQEPSTAQAREMPAHALATGCVDFALDLDRIPAALVSLVMAPGGADMLTVPTPPWARLDA